VLVIDDSVMLLSFVKEILGESNYDAAAAATADEGLRTAAAERPDLILLDYVLPDMKGDEVLARLLQDPATAQTPVVYMSGFGADLQSDPTQHPNVVGSLNKPFTSELLLKTVETYMPTQAGDAEEQTAEAEQPLESGWAPADNPDAMAGGGSPEPIGTALTEATPPAAEPADTATIEAAAGGGEQPWWSAPPAPPPTWSEPAPAAAQTNFESAPADQFTAPAAPQMIDVPPTSGATFFSGDTSFFSLNWALHTISKQKLTGTMRCFWNREPVELLARDGQILLATSHDPDLYCPESPITLVNVDADRTNAAREQQRETGQPLFITLAQEGLILREPAMQLVQHYGQKLFAQMWTLPRVRFAFEVADQLPAYANDVPAEEDIDHWALGTLRFIQFQELGNQADYDPSSIPAYTRDGFQRVQNLRLTVAEAQFASQFNGARSIAQIAKNLRLDLKFARLTLFRFMALEIVELWPQMVAAKQEKRGIFGRMFGE
jgi:CheY-like chemotaxis protein